MFIIGIVALFVLPVMLIKYRWVSWKTIALTDNSYGVYHWGKPVCDYDFQSQTYRHYSSFGEYMYKNKEAVAVINRIYEPEQLMVAIKFLKEKVCSNVELLGNKRDDKRPV